MTSRRSHLVERIRLCEGAPEMSRFAGSYLESLYSNFICSLSSLVQHLGDVRPRGTNRWQQPAGEPECAGE